jgi:hypothetical protein
MTIENFQNHFIFEIFLFLISSFGKVSPVNVVLAIALHMCCQSRRNLFWDAHHYGCITKLSKKKKKKDWCSMFIHKNKNSLKIIA